MWRLKWSPAQVLRKFAAIDRLGENVAQASSPGNQDRMPALIGAIGCYEWRQCCCRLRQRLGWKWKSCWFEGRRCLIKWSSGARDWYARDQLLVVTQSVSATRCHSLRNLDLHGIGHIIKGAKGADAQQESRVLMLSDQARSDANPILWLMKMTLQQVMQHRSVKGSRRHVLPSWVVVNQHTAERLVVRGFWDLLLLKSQLKKYVMEWLPPSKKSYLNAKEKQC